MTAQTVTETRNVTVVSVHTMPDVICHELADGGEIDLTSAQAKQLSEMLAKAAVDAELIEWSGEDDDDNNAYTVVKATGERFEG